MTLSGLLFAVGLLTPASPDTTPATVSVTVDSARHEVTITAGPYDLMNMPPLQDHGMVDLGASHDTPVLRFDWPVDGWLRGFRIELVGRDGQVIPRHVMHHMIMVNFARRQLLYSAAERLMGAGTETADANVPKTIGIPMSPGMDLGMYVAWHNDTGADLEGVTLKVSMQWTPKNQNPRPANAMPIYMDVNLTVGGTNTYDIPPGRSEKAHEFTMPIGGRLLGVSGHMHDHGVQVRLEDAESGKVLTQVETKREKGGKITGMGRKLFGITGDGLKLQAGRRYRVVGVYDNPTSDTLVQGAMAHMVGLFVPEDLTRWPKIDENDPDFQRDLASLKVRGTGESEHGDHEHGGDND